MLQARASSTQHCNPAFPPGSTFKVVTSSAALNTGQYTPNSLINGNSPLIVSGEPLQNDGNISWGPITLTKALTYSVNTVFAQVGEQLGIDTMAEYMKRFGFYSVPPLDFPKDEMTASGERIYTRNGSRLLRADERADRRRTHGDRPGQAGRVADADGDGRLGGRR